MRPQSNVPGVTREELIEVLSAISIITKDLTRKLIQTKKGGNPCGTDEKDESGYRRPTFL